MSRASAREIAKFVYYSAGRHWQKECLVCNVLKSVCLNHRMFLYRPPVWSLAQSRGAIEVLNICHQTPQNMHVSAVYNYFISV